jgi:serine/threonine-protein kinase
MSVDPKATVPFAEGLVGRVLKAKWRVDAVIGVGGMATVFRVTHRNASRAALKVLHPALVSDPNAVERFLREGYLANVVDHPGVVRVFDDDHLEDGRPFLIEELLIGESLETIRNRVGILAPEAVVEIGLQILDVLEAVSAHGIVHRDVKPDNVFVTRDGRIKLLDFGIARLDSGGSGATIDGLALGTPAFMAPEQARGRWAEVDARTDLFAVGATLYVLACGRHVREAETQNEELLLAMTAPVAPIRTVRPELPEALAALIDRSLELDRAERFQTAAEFAEALRATGLVPQLGVAVRGGTPSATLVPSTITGPTTKPPATIAPSRRRGPFVVAGAAAAFLAAAVVLLGLGRRTPSESQPPPSAVVASVVASVNLSAPSALAVAAPDDRSSPKDDVVLLPPEPPKSARRAAGKASAAPSAIANAAPSAVASVAPSAAATGSASPRKVETVVPPPPAPNKPKAEDDPFAGHR